MIRTHINHRHVLILVALIESPLFEPILPTHQLQDQVISPIPVLDSLISPFKPSSTCQFCQGFLIGYHGFGYKDDDQERYLISPWSSAIAATAPLLMSMYSGSALVNDLSLGRMWDGWVEKCEYMCVHLCIPTVILSCTVIYCYVLLYILPYLDIRLYTYFHSFTYIYCFIYIYTHEDLHVHGLYMKLNFTSTYMFSP